MSVGRKSKAQVDRVRKAVYDRDGGCVCAGSSWAILWPCGGAWTIQHRVTRGMGGSAEFDTSEHLLTMCAVHNAMDAGSMEFREACIRQGWSIPRWVMRLYPPSMVPVWYQDGWHWLQNRQRVKCSLRDAEKRMAEIYRTGMEPTHEIR
jgi:hypothetical protein